jgi:hypothetical protein
MFHFTAFCETSTLKFTVYILAKRGLDHQMDLAFVDMYG